MSHIEYNTQNTMLHSSQNSETYPLRINGKSWNPLSYLHSYTPHSTVPLNTLTDNQFHRLQVVYNKAIRITTNTYLSDRLSSRSLHRRLKTKPINTTIHEQAKNTWERLKDMHEDLYNSLLYPHPRRYRIHLPSSRTIAETQTPRSRYSANEPGSRARLPRMS